MDFNLFVVPQAFRLSSSSQSKFILAWTFVEDAPLSIKRITRSEEMAEVHDLLLMLLGKRVETLYWADSEAMLGSVQQQPEQCERAG